MVLLAFASVALLTPAIHAAIITPNIGDVILGFHATGNPGQTLNLEVDLGPVSQFYGLRPGAKLPVSALSVLDLSATYGTNWYSRADLYWGAIATAGRASTYSNSFVNVPIGTLWGTAPNGATAWNRGTSFAQKNASATIEAMFVAPGVGSLDGATSTTNSPNAAVIDATQGDSWTYQEVTLKGAGTSFGYFNPTIDSTVTNISASGQVEAQLYELQPTNTAVAGTLLGNLVLTQTGLSFQTSGGVPAIAVSGTLDFGDVPTGTTATAVLTITNTGTSTMIVSNITYPATVFSGVFSGPIAAGNATNLTVTFIPTGLTNYSGFVVVNSDAPSGTNTIATSGTGTWAATRIIGLSGILDFGSVTMDTTATITLTITNIGNSTLTVRRITYPVGFTGANSATIAAGSSQGLTVSFTPTALSSYSGTVIISSDATSGTSTISVAGAGTAPETRIIGLSGNLAFGTVTTGVTATATLTITNAGNSAMTVSNVTNPAGFTGDFSGSIAAGNATNVTVTFAPTAHGSYGGTVVVGSDATSGTSTIPASGAGGTWMATRIIGVSGTLVFGAVTTGTTATATLTITNAGNSILTVRGITYPAGFKGTFSGPIAAGSAANITVTFTSRALISYGGIVMVTSDATSGTSTIAATGSGTVTPTRIIGLSGNLAFGSVSVGTASTAILTITNAGKSTLTVSSISCSAGFTSAFSGPIAAGGAQGVKVTFMPAALSNYSGAVTVSSDATSGTSTIAVSGTGTAAVTRIIGLSGNLVFGTVTTGTTAAATLMLTNAGNSTLMVNSINYPAGFSGIFSGPIAADSATNITVTFIPITMTNYSGTVMVNCDATSGTNTIATSGIGGNWVVTRIIGLSGNLAFGAVTTGTTVTATLTITNAGNSTLTINSITYPAGFTGALSGTIAAGSVQSLTVTFAPTALSNYNGTVAVSSDATCGFSTIAVSGAGATTAPIFVQANPVIGGTVSGSGTYTVGVNAQISATANTYWRFSGWSDGNTNAMRSITVTSGSTTYTANFTSMLPSIITPPVITNSLLVVSNQFVVVAGDTNVFNVGAIDPVDNRLLRYQWVFGDGGTSVWSTTAVVAHIYPTNDCGHYIASVTVSNAQFAISSNIAVSAACQLMLTKLQIRVNLIKVNADSVILTAKLGLPGITNVIQLTGVPLVIDVGGAQASFTLAKTGRGVSANGACVLAYTKPTKQLVGYWTATIALSKENWHSSWAKYGLDTATHKSPGVKVTLPAALLIGNEAFAAEPQLHYTVTLQKTGTAQLIN